MSSNIPKHVGIIMDGNGRWATKRNLNRSLGHLEGSKTLKKTANYIFEKGVTTLSVFAFSTENFKRDKEEVDYLMDLFIKMFTKEFNYFIKKEVKIVFSKKESGLPEKLENIIKDLEDKTKDFTKATFNICLNYSGQDEIVDMVKKIVDKNIKSTDITKETIKENMYQNIDEIDLLIRTSGEFRISNFMLWNLAYSELYFTDTLFPDFDKKEFDKALLSFNNRDRRFGNVKKKN